MTDQDQEKPFGWELARVGDILKIRNGYAFKSSDYLTNGIPLIRQSDLGGDTIDLSNVKRVSPKYLKELPEFIVNEGDLMIGMSGSLGKIARYSNKEPAVQNQRTGLLVIEPPLLPSFCKFVLVYAEPQILAEGKGIAVQNVSAKEIEDCTFPLPPLAEQTRIVEKLEELFSDLDAGVAELKAAQKKLAQYRQALLKAAIAGALTAAWRTRRAEQGSPVETGAQLLTRILAERRRRWEEKQRAKFAAQGKTPPQDWQTKYPAPAQPDTSDLPELPEGWTWASVDQLSEIQGGIQKQPSRAPVTNKYPFLRVANVARGMLKLGEIHEIELFSGELERLVLQRGDVLIVEGNGSLSEIGRCALWDGSIENAVHQNHLIRARPLLVKAEFLETWLNSAGGIDRMTQLAATTSGLYTLSVSKIAKIPVPLPPLAEQVQAVEILRLALEEQERQATAVEFSLKQSEAQRKNILKAAFSGQLIAQDPNDEPASVLLERIRAERLTRALQPKPRKAKVSKQEVQTLMKKLVDVLAEAGDWITAEEAFRRCGVTDGTSTERIEELYAELRELVKATPKQVEVEREANSDKLKLAAHSV